MEFKAKISSWGPTSNAIVIPKTVMRTLGLNEGEEALFTVTKIQPIENIVKERPIREFHCQSCDHNFPSQDDDEDIYCPICGESDCVVEVNSIY